ncbi:glutamate-5-semialdehyde dehydrogenase [Kallotenue papyrolyticum]|uniref:glutamate-5-semialdehyde dehydrogenase n=1 Tax=Kallotenue papyrolyticum TaxID=1325125 RepID=UPI000471FC5B|nr:glutamate-5-semialdehyde dehydrogenase [Kallotenue papyrolyticum]
MHELSVEQIGQRARMASRRLATLPTALKDAALAAIADELRRDSETILAANARDVADAEAAGLREALIDRLRLTPDRLAAIAADVEQVTRLPDPVGERFDAQTLPNGLRVHKRRVPLGVVGVIYEARPNVTVDVAALCLKTGNAVILRGGKETLRSNAALVAAIRRALQRLDLPDDAVQVIADADRERVLELLRLDRYVDMIIPRGGEGLHRFCREHATVPVITGGIGVCHMYVDASADIEKALPVIINAKVQRPSVCNALDTLLVHRAIAPRLLPPLGEELTRAGVEIRADDEARALFGPTARVVPATADDWGTEFLALILSLRVVDGLDAALEHIWRYSSGHTEAILTEDPAVAARFVAEVDSAAVMVNASTRFNDGGQLGLGAEVAISTQKLHARGPMALRELTTYKWIVEGDGHVRA